MKDMITNKEIIGEPVVVPLFVGKKSDFEMKKTFNGIQETTTYKMFSHIDLIIDKKTYQRARRKSFFSPARYGCLLFISFFSLTIGLPLYLITRGSKTLTIIGLITLTCGIIATFVILHQLQGAGKTPEKNLALWYRYTPTANFAKDEVLVTSDEVNKGKISF